MRLFESAIFNQIALYLKGYTMGTASSAQLLNNNRILIVGKVGVKNKRKFFNEGRKEGEGEMPRDF